LATKGVRLPILFERLSMQKLQLVTVSKIQRPVSADSVISM